MDNDKKETRGLQVFSNPEFGEIRTLCEGDKILFCGFDVAKALGYAVPRKALFDHCKGVLKRNTLTNGGEQEMSFIPESDVYRLVFGSKLPTAEKFTDWVTEEVLPSIRKHGAYMTPEALEAALCSPDYLLKVVTALKNETDKRKELEAKNSALTVDLAIAQPKADYFDELCDRGTLTGLYETAKELGIAPRKFTQALIDRKYLYRDKKGKLIPYEAKNDGLFELKETYNEKTQWSGTQTLVTVKGRELFRMLRLSS